MSWVSSSRTSSSADSVAARPGASSRAGRWRSAAGRRGGRPGASRRSPRRPAPSTGRSSRNHTFLPVRSCSVPQAVARASTSARPRPFSRRLSIFLACPPPVASSGVASQSEPAAVDTPPSVVGWRSLTVMASSVASYRRSTVASVPACMTTLVTSSVTSSRTVSMRSGSTRPCSASTMNRRADRGESVAGGSVRVRRSPSSPGTGGMPVSVSCVVQLWGIGCAQGRAMSGRVGQAIGYRACAWGSADIHPADFGGYWRRVAPDTR